MCSPSIQTKVDMIDAPTDEAPKSKLAVPKINPMDSVVGEWVMIDMVREVHTLTVDQ